MTAPTYFIPPERLIILRDRLNRLHVNDLIGDFDEPRVLTLARRTQKGRSLFMTDWRAWAAEKLHPELVLRRGFGLVALTPTASQFSEGMLSDAGGGLYDLIWHAAHQKGGPHFQVGLTPSLVPSTLAEIQNVAGARHSLVLPLNLRYWPILAAGCLALGVAICLNWREGGTLAKIT